LVISDISNPYWTKIIQGTESFASENGYHVILCDSSGSEKKELAHLENLLKKQVDGILIAPIKNSPEPIVFVQNQNVPVVVIGYSMPNAEVDVVRCDTNEAAYDIVKLLIGLGHQRIAALTGPRQIITATDRIDGYKRALQEAGIPIHDELIQYGHFSPEHGYEMAKEMLKLTPLPTAVLTGNNFIAIGVTKALIDAGIRIPKDISVVTFVGPPPDLVVDPFFTMVSQPGYVLGEQAATLLVQRLTE
jgi:LacI family transcriptional regulator